MPKMNPIPFKKGDILRWKANGLPTQGHLNAVIEYRDRYGTSPMKMIGRSDNGLQKTGPDGLDLPIVVAIAETGEIVSPRWPGYFELDPFMTAVRKRRHG